MSDSEVCPSPHSMMSGLRMRRSAFSPVILHPASPLHPFPFPASLAYEPRMISQKHKSYPVSRSLRPSLDAFPQSSGWHIPSGPSGSGSCCLARLQFPHISQQHLGNAALPKLGWIWTPGRPASQTLTPSGCSLSVAPYVSVLSFQPTLSRSRQHVVHCSAS